MDRQAQDEESRNVKVVPKDEKCRVCGKDSQSTASTSKHVQDICTCESSSSLSTTNLRTPNPETGVESRHCKHATAGCTEIITSTDSDHESLCGYRNTYCKKGHCRISILIKDLLQHIQSNHTIRFGNQLALTWPIPEHNQFQVFPLYAFDTIIWELVIFQNNEISMSFFHESPNKLTPRLLVSVLIRVSDVMFADTIRVEPFFDEPKRVEEKFSIHYSKLQLYWAMRAACGGLAIDRNTTTVRQELLISIDTS